MHMIPFASFASRIIIVGICASTACNSTKFVASTSDRSQGVAPAAASTNSPGTQSPSGTQPGGSTGQPSSSSGGGSTAGSIGETTASTPGSPVPTSPSVTPCDQSAGLTGADLLTPTVRNGVSGNFLEYRIYLTDCQGQSIPFTASKILFDLSAAVQNPNTAQYRVTAPNGAIITGQMPDLSGSDLFGNFGSQYYHWETDKVIYFSNPATSIVLHIDLGGISMTPYGQANSQQLSTYLKWGDASVVEKTVQLVP